MAAFVRSDELLTASQPLTADGERGEERGIPLLPLKSGARVFIEAVTRRPAVICLSGDGPG